MDYKKIKTIIKDFEESSMTELEIESVDFKIRLSKNNVTKPVEHTVINDVKVAKEEKLEEEIIKTPISLNCVEVRSPLIGTFYAANNPNDEPFVRVGQQVETGETLCIIEAMKIMNEITAPVSGTIDKILVKNGTPIGFDDLLIVIV